MSALICLTKFGTVASGNLYLFLNEELIKSSAIDILSFAISSLIVVAGLLSCVKLISVVLFLPTEPKFMLYLQIRRNLDPKAEKLLSTNLHFIKTKKHYGKQHLHQRKCGVIR